MSIAAAVPASVGRATETRGFHPLECAPAVALTVTVEDSYRPANDPSRARRLEERLLASAQKWLAESGAASDSKGRDVHLDILGNPNGELTVVLSPRGERPLGGSTEADWSMTQTVIFPELEEPGTAEEIERAAEEQIEDAADTALSWVLGSQESCRPTRISSAKGRFSLELPPTNPEARGRYLRQLLKLDETEEVDHKPWAAMFERTSKGEDLLLSTFRLESEPTYPLEILVGASGYFVIRNFEVRTIYRPEGTVVRTFSIDDLLTPADAERFPFHFLSPVSLDDESDRLVISLHWNEIPRKIEIDLRTGLPVEPPHDLLPRLRVDSEAYGSGTRHPWRQPVCAGEPFDFAAPDLRHETSRRFHARASVRPLPEYSPIARRARLQGTVDVEVIVSENGKVLCARVTEFPMGLPAQVEAVVLGWRFQPVIEDGKPIRTIGRIAIHFHEVDPLDER
jgi:hypothetical protein